MSDAEHKKGPAKNQQIAARGRDFAPANNGDFHMAIDIWLYG